MEERLKKTMFVHGYEKDFAEEVVDQLVTEADGNIILSQLAVVITCS